MAPGWRNNNNKVQLRLLIDPVPLSDTFKKTQKAWESSWASCLLGPSQAVH